MNAAWILATLLASPTAIVNAHLEFGDGRTLEHGTVVFDSGRITSITSAAPPVGAAVIDGTGKVLTPGLIETQTQLGLVEVELEATTRDFALDRVPLAPGFRAIDGFNANTVRVPLAREEGITSVVVSPRGGVIAGTGAWIDLESRGDLRTHVRPPVAMFGAIDTDAAAVAGGARGGIWLALRELIADARDYRTHVSAYPRGEVRPGSLSAQHLEAMLPVIDGKLPLVLAAQRASDIVAAIELAKAQKLRIIIAGGAEAWLVAKELAAARVPVIVRPSIQAPASFETLGARDDIATLLDRAGVPLIISAWDADQNIRRLRQEAGMAVAYGLPHGAALRAIIATPAAAFGKGATHGVLATGYRADLVLWSGDPLEVTSVVERVWVGGTEEGLDTRQRALARRYLAR
ncbi:MAG: imidazolonepropionase [Myxococcota bacterium]